MEVIMIDSCRHGNAIITFESAQGCPLCYSEQYTGALESRIYELEQAIADCTCGNIKLSSLKEIANKYSPSMERI
jgi:hypothetical protein